jgi:hypothetical protein
MQLDTPFDDRPISDVDRRLWIDHTQNKGVDPAEGKKAVSVAQTPKPMPRDLTINYEKMSFWRIP